MASEPLQFSIREYRAEDAATMARLYYKSVRTLGARRYTPAQVAAWAPAPADPGAVHARAMDGRTTLVAVNCEQDVLGYVDLEANGHIDHLYCRPEAAGAGVASVLVDHVLARAASAGISTLYVEASDLARGLFERKGFAVIGRRDFELRGTGIHNYAMERIVV